ncbi:FtsW/RodA/SpoVE family cell cycle protein [Lactiplantibacillus fabifermentans]|uniref:Probable peptidoglycan glycosyltransferase FtsW n=2 Tax=Lactiplantibacillus fabifermentans TaxID=483011 RepID=A0A0R2NN89_9LACO|nr:FtsW/RodA/SpoVE family cell cycle protein [Lactiplantibacillus fabifermentans]ETY73955.1 cell division protein FtsW [Lactiplantibacillus fabifermentans T30PCM01]KRO27159.1 cell division protein ftsw [Lactiplantibacillus fabifermentans DSM 21115]
MLKKLHYMDYVIFIPYLILCGIGIVMVYSASSYVAAQNGTTPTGYLFKQVMWVVIGFVITIICMRLKITYYKRTKLLFWVSAIIFGMLIYLRFFGKSINGAAGWITFGPVSLQPAEFIKFYLIVYLATMISRREAHLGQVRIRDLGAQLILAGAMIFLVAIQPDIGGATINLAIMMVILLATGINYLVGVGLFAGAVIAFQWILVPIMSNLPQSVLSNSYQLRRFLGFLNPFTTASGAGTQLVNSYYAISNGGLTGVGIGNSLQKRGYLPEPNTDFIMSITAEELGLIGVMFVMGLLLVIVIRTIYIGVRSTNTFNTLVCYGVAAYLTIQAFINVGGIVGIIPITGVTFPFMSYGGSSMMVLALSLGLVLNISALEKYWREHAVLQ